MTNSEKTQKCYNSFSCIASVLIIMFVLGSITWDIFVSKPAMHESIQEIREDIRDIHEKIESQLQKTDTISIEYVLSQDK